MQKQGIGCKIIHDYHLRGNDFTISFLNYRHFTSCVLALDACREANLPEPEYNQNASFVWITFKRNTTQPYNHTTPTTPQVKNPTTPTTPTTSKREDAKLKRLKTLLAAIGENGANLKVLMEVLRRKDRKGFVSTYITPNIEAGYIAMLYPETPNHPMQSYYLTNKGREALNNL